MGNKTNKERVEIAKSLSGILAGSDLTLEEAQKLRFKERYGIDVDEALPDEAEQEQVDL